MTVLTASPYSTPQNTVEEELTRLFDATLSLATPQPLPLRDLEGKIPRPYLPLFDSAHRPSATLMQFMNELPGLSLPEGMGDIPIAVYSNELSSILAYALNSKDYHSKFTTKFGYPPSAAPSASSSKGLQPDVSALFSVGTGSNHHVECRLTEDLHGVRYRVKVVAYFAQGFQALRRLCCGDDNQFLGSMARCQDWQARGGKSGSAWERTLDGRYIIKQISRPEAVSFLEFGPVYFRYMGYVFSEGIPTILAKCLGVFHIHSRIGSKSSTLTVMVIENLFCGRRIAKVYDLKGSLRSRYVKQKEDRVSSSEVWLDENLLEDMFKDPITMDEQGKAKLMTTIYNDTLFLAHNDVMDYSLLVGIDEQSKELVVGIIDYFRKYTWDKQLESWIKLSGVLGGRGQVPTVISPEQYMIRFREQMWLYFVLVPHKFTNFALSPPDDPLYITLQKNVQEK